VSAFFDRYTKNKKVEIMEVFVIKNIEITEVFAIKNIEIMEVRL